MRGAVDSGWENDGQLRETNNTDSLSIDRNRNSQFVSHRAVSMVGFGEVRWRPLWGTRSTHKVPTHPTMVASPEQVEWLLASHTGGDLLVRDPMSFRLRNHISLYVVEGRQHAIDHTIFT